MNILLTGATGYLGSLLAKNLAEKHTLFCVVREPRSLGRLSGLQGHVTVVPINKLGCLEEFDIDTVIHTACTYARGGNSLDEVLKGNLYFPLRILQLAEWAGARRWVNTNTCLPPDINTYALAKNQFAQWGQYFAERGKIQFIDLILEQFYGLDAPESHFLSWVTRKLQCDDCLELTVGTQKRDFIYIDDVLEVYKKVLETDFSDSYMQIPVGTGEAPSIREVVAYLKDITGSNSVLQFGAVDSRPREYSSACDATMIKSMGITPLHWKDGMRQLIEVGGAR